MDDTAPDSVGPPMYEMAVDVTPWKGGLYVCVASWTVVLPTTAILPAGHPI